MGKKKRDYVEKHKQSLGDQLENPETYGVRVSQRCAADPSYCSPPARLPAALLPPNWCAVWPCSCCRRSRGLASDENLTQMRMRRRPRSLCRRR